MKYLFFLFFFIFCEFYSCHFLKADVQITKELENLTELEYQAPDFKIYSFKIKNDNYNKIYCPELNTISNAGLPVMPFYSFLMEIEGSVKIEIDENNSSKNIDNINISPSPNIWIDDNNNYIKKYEKNYEIYNKNNMFPKTIVEIDKSGIFRGTSFKRIKLYPFQWNPVTKQLKYYKRIKFKLIFNKFIKKKQNIESYSFFEKIKNETILNYKTGINNLNKTIYKKDNNPKKTNKNINSQIINNSIKIFITENGLYKITYDDIKNTGIDPSKINPYSLKLINCNLTHSFNVFCDYNCFKQGDYIEFYARNYEDKFTSSNIYWLCFDYLTENMKNKKINQIQIIDGYPYSFCSQITNFWQSLHFEENSTIYSLLPSPTKIDIWFWERIFTNDNKNYTINIPSPSSINSNAYLKIGFTGRSLFTRNTVINFNNIQNISDDIWAGNVEYVQISEIKQNNIINGDNNIEIISKQINENIDSFYLNWIELDYMRDLKAVDDNLLFSISANDCVEIHINNFNNNNIRLFDITDLSNLKEIKNFKVNEISSKFSIYFQYNISEKNDFFVLCENKIKAPQKIKYVKFDNLKDTSKGADYIIIGPESFIPELNLLGNYRKKTFQRVEIVTIESIYNNFNSGLFSPNAIKDFLKFAYENWTRPAPSFVLLIGDANIDYKDLLKTGKKNIVPTHLSYDSQMGIVPDDNWFVCIEGEDSIPEMAVGRLSGNTNKDISDQVQKIINFETNQDIDLKQILLISDNPDNDTPLDFKYEEIQNELCNYIPDFFEISKIYLDKFSNNAELAKSEIISSINKGSLITNFVGHGGLTNWAGEFMFDSSDIQKLTNQNKLTFAISLNCLSGYFAHFSTYCLTEGFVKTSSKGAVAAFGPSGLSNTSDVKVLGKQIFSNLLKYDRLETGKIIYSAKINAYGSGMSDYAMQMFNLIGDPAVKIKFNPVFCDLDLNGKIELKDIMLALKLFVNVDDNKSIKNNVNNKIDMAFIIYLMHFFSFYNNNI